MTGPFIEKDVEILIATMNRTSFDFLIPMFPKSHFSDYNILIINQTQQERFLTSNYPNVRVVNVREEGLSKSRNLALNRAKGKILVITDDDVVFHEDFCKTICEAYNEFPLTANINFCATNPEGLLLRKYPKKSKANLSSLELYNVMSIEMTLNRELVINSGCHFDENFGLNSTFMMGEEAAFLHDLKRQKQDVVFYKKAIVSHPEITTNDNVRIEQKYYVSGAIFTRNHGWFYIYWILLKLFFDIKQGKLQLRYINHAIRSVQQGRNAFLKIKNL